MDIPTAVLELPQAVAKLADVPIDGVIYLVIGGLVLFALLMVQTESRRR